MQRDVTDTCVAYRRKRCTFENLGDDYEFQRVNHICKRNRQIFVITFEIYLTVLAKFYLAFSINVYDRDDPRDEMNTNPGGEILVLFRSRREHASIS